MLTLPEAQFGQKLSTILDEAEAAGLLGLVPLSTTHREAIKSAETLRLATAQCSPHWQRLLGWKSQFLQSPSRRSKVIWKTEKISETLGHSSRVNRRRGAYHPPGHRLS